MAILAHDPNIFLEFLRSGQLIGRGSPHRAKRRRASEQSYCENEHLVAHLTLRSEQQQSYPPRSSEATPQRDEFIRTAAQSRADGALEPLASGSTRPVAQTLTHAVISVARYFFSMP
jgi:hypothetical protein